MHEYIDRTNSILRIPPVDSSHILKREENKLKVLYNDEL